MPSVTVQVESRASVEPPVPRCEDLAACPVCGGPSSRGRIASPDRLLFVRGVFRYVECRRCRTVYQNPRVREDDLALCYPAGYYTHTRGAPWEPTPAPPGSLRDRVRRAIRRAADRLPDEALAPPLALLGALLALSPGLRRRARLGLVDGLAPPPGRQGRCLEVGPGAGIELACLRLLGWDAHGLEADPVAAEAARQTSGAEVRVGTLATTDYPAGSFDLVYMGHVFEHLPDPGRALRRCLELLEPGGRLALVYPNPDALSARRFGSLSPVWDPPRHLVLPPIRAIQRLVAASGFVDVDARTLARRAAVNAGAARRRRRGLTWQPSTPTRPRLPDRALALAETLLVALGWPVGEEVLLRARRPSFSSTAPETKEGRIPAGDPAFEAQRPGTRQQRCPAK